MVMLSEHSIGLQLWTVREQSSRDLEGTLREVRAAGYRVVEVVGYGNGTVTDMRRCLDEWGIRAVSMHVRPSQLEESFERTLEDAAALECDFIVLSGSPEWCRGSATGVSKFAERLNEWGAICNERGRYLGYHNHAREFAPMGSTTMFDILITECEPALIHFQIDIYWAMYAHMDPGEVIQSCAGKVPMLHAKEMSARPDRGDTTIGDGVTPWESVLAAAERAHTQWLLVEQEDDPANAIRDMRYSRERLTGLLRAVDG